MGALLLTPDDLDGLCWLAMSGSDAERHRDSQNFACGPRNMAFGSR